MTMMMIKWKTNANDDDDEHKWNDYCFYVLFFFKQYNQKIEDQRSFHDNNDNQEINNFCKEYNFPI